MFFPPLNFPEHTQNNPNVTLFFCSLDCEDTSQVLDVEEEEQGMVDRCQAPHHNLSSSVEYFPVMFVVATAHTFKFSIVVDVVAGGEEFLM